MWLARHRAERDALSRYWNALVSNASHEELAHLATPLTGDQIALIARLRNRQWQLPDPAFEARLERDLRRDLAARRDEALVSSPPEDLTAFGPDHAFPPVPSGYRRWSAAALTTALLVAFSLAAVFVAFIRYTPRSIDAPVAVPSISMLPATPAQSATPASEATPESPALWRTVPVPSVGAEFVWQTSGAAIAGPPAPQIAVDPDGNLWMIDGAESRFVIFGPDGVFLETWGEQGQDEGQFAFRREAGGAVGGIGFTPFHADEDFYVADSQNARIQRFDANRKFVHAWGERGTDDGQFLEPIGVTVGYDGLVYVVDGQRDDVQVFDRDGTFIRKIGGHGNGPGQLDHVGWGVADPVGYFWVADGGNRRLQHTDHSGELREPIGSGKPGKGELSHPTAVAADMDGRIYVIDRNSQSILVFDEQGRFANAIDGAAAGGTAFVNPVGIVVDWDGNLYVQDSDGSSASVQMFRLDMP